MARQGQVAIFVLVGIVVLLGVVLFLALRPERDAEPEALPAEFAPVQEHIQLCVRETAIDGLKILAMHGGYLDPLDEKETGERLSLNPLDATESDLVRLNPADNASAVPYYYYLKSPNGCQHCLLSTLTPTKEHMEAQLRRYILAHLADCTNFGIFPDIEVTADPRQELTVTFTDESVILEYERLITMRKGDTTERTRSFPQRLDIPFLRYHALAKQITQREMETQFLESYLMYIASVYGGLDAPLPPIAGYEETFSPAMWVLPSVQDEYSQILHGLTPSLQVIGTAGVTAPPATGDAYVDGFLTMAYLDLINDSGISADDLKVSIFAPGHPVYLDVHPRKGLLIRPRSNRQSGILFIPPRQQNYYDFYYDISAPFLVEIRHEDAIEGTDMSFLFALEANVRENKNMVQWLLGRGTIPWSNDFVAYSITDPASAVANATLPPSYTHNSSLTTLLCDETQRTAPVSVRTFDARTNRPLEGVSFSFSCGLYATCEAGISSEDENGIYSELDAMLPACIGGLLRAEREGYSAVTVPLSTRAGGAQRLADLTLDPFMTKEVRIVKRQVRKDALTEELSLGAETPLNLSAETVFLTFIRRGADGDAPVTATAFLGSDRSVTEVSLIPGLYEVRAMYLYDEGYVIRKGCQMIEGRPLPENDTEIKPAPWGGLELSDETFLWLAERSDLYSAGDLVVPVFVAPPPVCLDDLESMGETREYVRRFSSEATPRFG